MSVNTLSIEQAYSLIKSIHDQATGKSALTPTDPSSFVSVATKTLATGYDTVLNAISQVLTRTMIAVRPFEGSFNGLDMTGDRWGAITRKISFGDVDPATEDTYALTDGQSYDDMTVRKVPTLETHYYGSLVYSDHITVYTRQLDVAFQSPEEFGRFMAGLMTHWSNIRRQWLNEQKRMIVNNFISGKNALNSDVIHLLTEYNTATGMTPPLTATTVMQPANYKPFMEWVFARVAGISRLMTERSELFQEKITGYDINRHTPLVDQRVYMSADFLEAMRAMVLADTYHDSFLTYSDVEPVSYWQAIQAPRQISTTPVYIDNTGAVTVGTAQVINNVVGVLFDRDAMGFNINQDEVVASHYNARGQFYNLWYHFRGQWQNDFTEKGVVLLMD